MSDEKPTIKPIINMPKLDLASLVILIASPLLAFWTNRTLEGILTYVRGAPTEVPYWLSLVATIVFSKIVLAINVITELFRIGLS